MTLDVTGLDVELAGTRILDDVHASIRDGHLVGVVGPNGAGKSTLLRAMNGLITPTAGTVLVAGDDVHALSSAAASRRIATVPQDASVSFEFTVRQVVEMGRHPHTTRFGTDTDTAVVDRAMARTGVAQFAARDVTSLSGGERQRVLLARALAQAAPVLLLDEPTASLDVNHQIRTLEVVRDLADSEDRAVVAAIHDLDLAARYCDELVVVADGRVHDAGAPRSVLTPDTIRAAFDARVAVGTDPATGAVTVTPLPDRTSAAADTSVHVVGGGDSATPVVRRLVSAGASVSVGPVVEGDTDHETARRVGCPCTSVAPFTRLEDTTAASATRADIAAADVIAVPVAAAARPGVRGLLTDAVPTLAVGDAAGAPEWADRLVACDAVVSAVGALADTPSDGV